MKSKLSERFVHLPKHLVGDMAANSSSGAQSALALDAEHQHADVGLGEFSLDQLLTSEMLEKASNLLRGVAHPTRLAIVQELIQHEPLCVGELAKALSVEISLLSHHLSQMRLVGLLATERRGKHVFYRIAEPQVVNLISCLSSCHIMRA